MKKIMKRSILLLLALCLALALIGMPTFAEETTTSGTCGESLTWMLENGVLTISGTGEMEEYNYDTTSPWYADCELITSVVIEDGVTSIGDYAFWGCTGLTSITIPDSVTSIGDGAFWGCTGLTSVTIPDSVTSIGELAFQSCTSLISITIPDSVTSIGSGAFAACTKLTSITLPENVTSICDNIFHYCYSLTCITIPTGVTSIGECAFRWCRSLTSITIPDSVISIGFAAFDECGALTDVYYGGSDEDWAEKISPIANDCLRNATIHYNSTGPEVEDPKEPAIIIDGTDESYVQGSDGSVVIHCSGELADFVSVSVDGKIVDGENYTLEAGSTILTFKSTYLETLSVGEHAVTLTYTTGAVDTSLTVLKNSEQTEPEKPSEPTNPTKPENPAQPEKPADPAHPDNPKTGDTALLIPAVLMSLCALYLLCLNRKKRAQ